MKKGRKSMSKLLKYVALAVFTLALGLLAGCGNDSASNSTADSGATITIHHKSGDTTVPVNPKRVVVLDLATLDTMDRLDLESHVVGIPNDLMPAYLDKYKDTKTYTSVGNLKAVNFEKISQLKPDLIIINGRQEESYKELAAIAPTINLGLDMAHYWDSVQHNVKIIGQIFNKEKEADEALLSLQNRIDNLKKDTADSDKQGVVVMVSGGKLSVFGPGTRYGLAFDTVGAKSILPVPTEGKETLHGQRASFEFLAEKNPDFMIVIDRDNAIGQGGSAKDVMNTPLINQTKAAQTEHIIYVDPGLWYLSGGGLESTALMLDDIAQAIQ
ncbi:ABC transporter [Veillonella sp. R32]|nr:ABC transporter [Veillonella sp. R32]